EAEPAPPAEHQLREQGRLVEFDRPSELDVDVLVREGVDVHPVDSRQRVRGRMLRPGDPDPLQVGVELGAAEHPPTLPWACRRIDIDLKRAIPPGRDSPRRYGIVPTSSPGTALFEGDPH